MIQCDSGQPDVNVVEANSPLPAFLPHAFQLAQAGNLDAASSLLTPTNLAWGQNLMPGSAVFVSWHTLLGSTWRRLGNLLSALISFEQLKRHQPTVAVFAELIGIYRLLNRFQEALVNCEQALSRWEHEACLWAHYAECLIATGRLDEGVALYKRLIDSGQADADLHAAYLWSLYYISGWDRGLLHAAYADWVRRYGTWAGPRLEHVNVLDPDRRLKIGYLSTDFRTHSVTYTFEPLLDAHDRMAFEIYGYGCVAYPDRTTARLSDKFSHYRSVWGQSVQTIAERIQADKIDILVTLSAHCSATLMRVLAGRPAPLQVDIGSLSSTALPQVDYRITDALQDPPESQAHYTEKLESIAGGFIPYRVPDNIPAVSSLPALERGFVTFGAFGSHLKINTAVVACWAAVLRQVPESRLWIKCAAGEDPVVIRHLCHAFQQRGIVAERVRIQGWLPKTAHWKLYNQIDIVLDSFPFNGGVTTLEGLWMGVPTVTLAGDRFSARMGMAILTHAGLSELVGENASDMAGKAVTLARQPGVLADLRARLRATLLHSPLCDYERMVRGLETAYRQQWQRYCKEQVQDEV